ncbi:hypothetical protein OM428_02720 [Enterococcus gallinarum]|nr:hypothetical protein [Enterococcus gallinarum]MCW3744212.1 hypothetical protein [Enterococcus gallinarum]
MKPKIGLQLWSIQEACKEDLFQALESVKKAGMTESNSRVTTVIPQQRSQTR